MIHCIKTCNAQHTHTLPVYFQLFCKLLHTILLKITESKVTVAEGNVGTSTILFLFFSGNQETAAKPKGSTAKY